jgi:hypothetical protein
MGIPVLRGATVLILGAAAAGAVGCSSWKVWQEPLTDTEDLSKGRVQLIAGTAAPEGGLLWTLWSPSGRTAHPAERRVSVVVVDLEPGRYEVVLTEPGGAIHRRRFAVSAGSQTNVRKDFVPDREGADLAEFFGVAGKALLLLVGLDCPVVATLSCSMDGCLESWCESLFGGSSSSSSGNSSSTTPPRARDVLKP